MFNKFQIDKLWICWKFLKINSSINMHNFTVYKFVGYFFNIQDQIDMKKKEREREILNY